MQLEREIAATVAYLESDAARRALATDVYWPKWHHPWWHMLLLHEMGETARIPTAVIQPFIDSLNAMPVKAFPQKPGDPDGPCHCQMGNVMQVLSARGVDLDAAAPWTKSWFAPYQMADGGLNCDEGAYVVPGECPSSMVGTIAAFEAILLSKRPWSATDERFVERAAGFLIARELRLGSPTKYNADERVSATAWPQLCFPRYYFYDVLRGLNALSLWGEVTGEQVPESAIAWVVDHMRRTFPDGRVYVGRDPTAACGTRLPMADGTWGRGPSARFPLLDAVSTIGGHSEPLSRQWRAVKARLKV